MAASRNLTAMVLRTHRSQNRLAIAAIMGTLWVCFDPGWVTAFFPAYSCERLSGKAPDHFHHLALPGRSLRRSDGRSRRPETFLRASDEDRLRGEDEKGQQEPRATSARQETSKNEESESEAGKAGDRPDGLDGMGGVDWRDFRAMLVQQEMSKSGENESDARRAGKVPDGWAYETRLIETGSMLLSTPSSNFALNQQYFHKNVIFLIDHSEKFSVGLILNRPTAFDIYDVSNVGLNFTQDGIDGWNVWFGGDYQGINDRVRRYFVIHGLEQFAAKSKRIIRGVYSIDFMEAVSLVASGDADKDDFLLLVGCCVWRPGQLQVEFDSGETWTVAAVDQQVILGELRRAQSALRKRLSEANKGQTFAARDVGDGLEMWERLYSALGAEFQKRLTTFMATDVNTHTDEMLRRWIDRCLIPSRYSKEGLSAAQVAALALNQARTTSTLKAGMLLRGSPSLWLLGKPVEHEKFELEAFRPSQYFHKSIVVVIRNAAESRQSMVALLNGPMVGRDSDGDVLWGGPDPLGEMHFGTNNQAIRVNGITILFPGTLELLVNLGAFEVVESVELDGVLEAPAEERWLKAGGTIDTQADARSAQLGDVQRRLWYKRFLDIDIQ